MIGNSDLKKTECQRLSSAVRLKMMVWYRVYIYLGNDGYGVQGCMIVQR